MNHATQLTSSAIKKSCGIVSLIVGGVGGFLIGGPIAALIGILISVPLIGVVLALKLIELQKLTREIPAY